LALTDHTLDAFAIDASGQRVEGLSASVQFGIGDYYVAIGDARVQGYGDDVSSDDVSSDGRNDSKGFPPILNDRLTAALGYSHTVENEGVPGTGFSSLDGVAAIGSILAAHPDAQTILILFGPDDAMWSGTLSGAGLESGEADYANSYKHNIRSIAAAVQTDGREAVLGKVSPCFGDYSGTPFPDPATAPFNVLIREYNQAIDEVVTELGIAVSPPDFYGHFEAHPEEYRDDCYPNGVGYQSMADLWRDALVP
jgi:lysophospholipase L1-like esterase